MKLFILKHRYFFGFLVVLLIGMYLRFYRIYDVQSFGWDQARDAWKTRDILMGQIVLDGPRTGVGHFNLGPLWYYLLSPFYYFAKLDPRGANYLNILVNIFNFCAIFWVTKKIYSPRIALLTSILYATNRYLIEINRISWNVSPVIGVSILIFYGIYQVVYKENVRWIYFIALLSGIFFHLHFAVVFLPPIIFLSFLMTKNKRKIFTKSMISLPLFLLWFIPSVVWDLQTKNSNVSLFQNFINDYLMRFHFRFLMLKFHDAFAQFHKILDVSADARYSFIKFIPFIIFIGFLIFEKNRKKKLLGYLISLWFVVPALVYTFYGGVTSEYYVILNAPQVLYILLYIQEKFLCIKPKKLMVIIVIIVWGLYVYSNTKKEWVKPAYGALHKQEDEIKKRIGEGGEKIEYNEGVISSYLYHIWAVDTRLTK